MAFSLPGCIERAGPPQGNSNAGKVSSTSGAEKNPGSPQLPRNKKSSAGGYRLIACKDYPYGSGPNAFGIIRSEPPIAIACDGFSAGGPEGNLYVLDLLNRNVSEAGSGLACSAVRPGGLAEAAWRLDALDLRGERLGVLVVSWPEEDLRGQRNRDFLPGRDGHYLAGAADE